ncbi:hypothetical protein SLA2020_310230 [Shorea laevis]
MSFFIFFGYHYSQYTGFAFLQLFSYAWQGLDLQTIFLFPLVLDWTRSLSIDDVTLLQIPLRWILAHVCHGAKDHVGWLWPSEEMEMAYHRPCIASLRHFSLPISEENLDIHSRANRKSEKQSMVNMVYCASMGMGKRINCLVDLISLCELEYRIKSINIGT